MGSIPFVRDFILDGFAARNAATNRIAAILAISPGMMVNPPTPSHLVALFLVTPTPGMRTMTSIRMLIASSGTASFFSFL